MISALMSLGWTVLGLGLGMVFPSQSLRYSDFSPNRLISLSLKCTLRQHNSVQLSREDTGRVVLLLRTLCLSPPVFPRAGEAVARLKLQPIEREA